MGGAGDLRGAPLPNLFGVGALATAGSSVLAFAAATSTGKGEDVLPLGIALLAGVLAVLLAAAGWVWGRRRRVERVSVLCGFALGCVGVALVVVGGPAVIRKRSSRQPCATHLRQIGQGLQLYAMAHGGRLPDRLQDLIIGVDALPATALICPDGPDQRGRCSYDYLGAGRMFSDFGPDDVVAFEPPPNHQSDGGYALFGDGHVEYVYPREKLRVAVARAKQLLTTRPAATSPAESGPAG